MFLNDRPFDDQSKTPILYNNPRLAGMLDRLFFNRLRPPLARAAFSRLHQHPASADREKKL